ncbi:MAG: peptidylprolyl isomerase [Bacteroidia bacterium]|nr:peptidylprolyl isomerase [Bacteroidia bacterium]
MKRIIFFFWICVISFCGFAQPAGNVLDKVVGVVGKYMILKSDVDIQLRDARAGGYALGPNGDCEIFEQLLYQKLLLAQAEKDSVTVTDGEVENELGRRMSFYIQKFGSEEDMVIFYGKEINLLKEDFRKEIKELLIAQKMQQKVTGELKVTPAEIRAFFKDIPTDSLPLINSEVEIGQIVKKPEINDKAKTEAREKISALRKRVVEGGESFAVLATLYSEDPGSAQKGGLYENTCRGQFVPEFDAAAFRLKPGEISEVIETAYGYHVIMLVARRGDCYDSRHILISPKMTQEDLGKCKSFLDSVHDLIKSGKIKFCDAAAKFSDEKETKNNCGLMINQGAGNTRFDLEELGQMDEKLVFMLDKMELNDMSTPLPYLNRDQKQAFRIFYLKTRIPPHKANLKDDYQKLQNLAQQQKQQKVMQEWINKKIKTTYIKIDPYYNQCKFNNNWLNPKS